MIRYDTIGEIITEISESGKFNVSDIQQTFGKHGKEVNDDTALALKQLLFDVAQMPVNIFEAKPERVVHFDEVKAAILPKDTDHRIVDELQKNGVPVQFYEAGNDAERLQIVNSMESVKFSERDTDSVSNRTLLANAFEGVAQNDIERKKLQEYRKDIASKEAEEQKLRKLRDKIRELSFARGPRDKQKLSALREEAQKTENRLNFYDKRLLRLEASKPLRDVLEREKQKAYRRAEQRGRARVAEKVEDRKRTEMRHKIQNVVAELNRLLLSNDKKNRVPDSLKKAVADALDLVNMETVAALDDASESFQTAKNTTGEGGVKMKARNKKTPSKQQSANVGRSVKQRSSNSTHVNMPSAAAAELLGIDNLSDTSESVKCAGSVLGSFYQSFENKNL